MAAAVTAALAGPALAANRAAACEVEEWRWKYQPAFERLSFEGVASCERGTVTIRAYDGEGEECKFGGWLGL